MSSNTHAAAHDEHGEHHVHPPEHYIKIWAILVALLIVSILGPMAEIQWLTLLTAFGIAMVKAYLVCSYFMHLNIEKKVVWYFLIISLFFVGLFYFGVAPDVMNHRGNNWENQAAQQEVERALKAAEANAEFAHH